MKTGQKGFSLVEALLVILVLGLVGFGGFYVWNKNQTNKTQQQDTTKQEPEKSFNSDTNAETSDLTKYSNSDFAFTLEYPANLTATQVNTREGYEGAGMTMSFILDEDVYVISKTSDYQIGPKGPIPLSGIVAKGYVDKNGILYYSDGESKLTADSIERRDNYLYIENKILFQGDEDPIEYIALFNTPKGGLVIYTENPEKIKLVEEMAKTVSAN